MSDQQLILKGRSAFFAGQSRSTCRYDGSQGSAWRHGYDQAINESVALVLAGKTANIGMSTLCIFEQSLCATDAYGCDKYFNDTTEDAVRRAIALVISVESAPVGSHPAERTMSN